MIKVSSSMKTRRMSKDRDKISDSTLILSYTGKCNMESINKFNSCVHHKNKSFLNEKVKIEQHKGKKSR